MLFSIGVGSTTVTSYATTQGTVEGFKMIGMNVVIVDILFGVRMFWLGSLLIEGTSDPFGRLWVANVIRRMSTGEAVPEALVFSTNFRRGFEPGLFQPVLPKNLIHRMVPGEAIYDFFNAWKIAYREAQPYRSLGLRQLFAATAHSLSNKGYAVNTRKKWLAKGYLIWYTNKTSNL